MLLIIGLGNPGEKYAKNRHNAGFILLDELRWLWNFPQFEFEKKFNSELSEGALPPSPLGLPRRVKAGGGIEGEGSTFDSKTKVILARPQTFMNNSGEAVQKIMSFYKLTPANIIVIHDDLDLEIGKYKISADSSAAGHNGVQDIFDKLGTQQIQRARLGVETAGGRANRIIPGEDFVLQDFTAEEYEKVINLAKELQSLFFLKGA